MHVGLNLATKPLVSHRRFLVGSTLLGILGSLLFIYLGWHFYSLRQADAAFRAREGKIQQEMERLQEQRNDLQRFYAKEENRNLQDRAKFIGTVIEARSFNWTKMFMDLETVLPEGVHVVSVTPKLANGRAEVKLVIGASSDENKLKFLRTLESSRDFSRVQVLAERAPAKPEGTDRILVDLIAIYL